MLDHHVMPEPRRKFHHFRPILHLRHFANANSALWVYNREGPDPSRPVGIQVVGGEKYLYSPEDGDDPKDDGFERWLAEHVDGPAAAPLSKIAMTGDLGSLAHGERSRLAAYLGVLDMRTPRVRDFIVALFGNELNEEFKEMTLDRAKVKAEILAQSGVEYSDEELELLIASYYVEVNKGSWLEFIQRNINVAGKRIFDMGWRMVRAPNSHSFITNDVGAVKFVGSFRAPRAYKLGFAASRSHWLVPLSPQWALALDPSDAGSPVEATTPWLKAVNRQIVADAYRFVYSRHRAPFVARWFQSSAARHSGEKAGRGAD